MDAHLRQGLADSALPLVPQIVAVSKWIRARITALYLSLLRLWFAFAILLGSVNLSKWPFSRVSQWLPIDLAARLPISIYAIGALLLLGLATRYVSTLVIVALFANSMMNPRGTDSAYWLVLFAILVIHGGGRFSLDRALHAGLNRFLPASMRVAQTLNGLPRVVIAGAGFAGMSCAAALKRVAVSVTLIDRVNYHLFQPLLYQVATAALSPGDIATPVRQVFRDAFKHSGAARYGCGRRYAGSHRQNH